MTNTEVNKIIAEYKGYSENYISEYDSPKHERSSHIEHFTESLDLLVPVWEKLNDENNTFDTLKLDLNYLESASFVVWSSDFFRDGRIMHYTEGRTIQEATAHATAKAIKTLQEK